MNAPLPGCPMRCLPRTFHSRPGIVVRLQCLQADEQPQLLAMYLAFQPRNAFQGLPPVRDEVCTRWVDDMLRNGFNVAAWSDNKTVVGHAALFPMKRGKCEMLVAVSPTFQNLGIGTELVRACADVAAELGLEQLWLPVEATNVRARHVYEKCGFAYESNTLGREVDMVCDVTRRRSAHKAGAAARTPAAVAAPLFLTPAADSPTRVP
jgi:ribosomal protein S18 acetylase RimI-like enzyme